MGGIQRPGDYCSSGYECFNYLSKVALLFQSDWQPSLTGQVPLKRRCCKGKAVSPLAIWKEGGESMGISQSQVQGQACM